MERDENTQREPFTPSEAMAMANLIKDPVKAEATFGCWDDEPGFAALRVGCLLKGFSRFVLVACMV
jgi:hypothetical protein